MAKFLDEFLGEYYVAPVIKKNLINIVNSNNIEDVSEFLRRVTTKIKENPEVDAKYHNRYLFKTYVDDNVINDWGCCNSFDTVRVIRTLQIWLADKHSLAFNSSGLFPMKYNTRSQKSKTGIYEFITIKERRAELEQEWSEGKRRTNKPNKKQLLSNSVQEQNTETVSKMVEKKTSNPTKETIEKIYSRYLHYIDNGLSHDEALRRSKADVTFFEANM